MSEDKKKIDLKARLGKKGVPAAPGGSAVPPPVGIPKPVGLPVPPFGKKGGGGIKVDASDPYAAVSAADAIQPKEQTLKIEMSEEVVQAQKRGRSKVVFLAFATALVGGLLGYTIGGRIEANKGAIQAVQGAKELADLVAKANTEVEKLADALKSAKAKLAENKYPEAEVATLGGIVIPISGADVYGKGFGRFNKDSQTLLINYIAAVESANDQKQRVQMFLGAKKTVTDYLTQQATPKVRWVLFITSSPLGPWAAMKQAPTAFLVASNEKGKDAKGKEVAYAWPETFKIQDSGKTFELKRYQSGNPVEGPKVVPVDPSSMDDVCPSDVMQRLISEVAGLEAVLRGQASTGAGEDEKLGLIDMGKKLVEALNKIGQP
jgi:hypothetical protein